MTNQPSDALTHVINQHGCSVCGTDAINCSFWKTYKPISQDPLIDELMREAFERDYASGDVFSDFISLARTDNGEYEQALARVCFKYFKIGYKAAIATQQPNAINGWQPIETAPKDSENGIIGRMGFFVFWTDRDDEDNIWFTQNRFYEDSYHAKKYGEPTWKPTHWMPLPAPPAMNNQGGE